MLFYLAINEQRQQQHPHSFPICAQENRRSHRVQAEPVVPIPGSYRRFFPQNGLFGGLLRHRLFPGLLHPPKRRFVHDTVRNPQHH